MIEIQNLQKVVDGKTVVDVEALSIDASTIAGLIGPVDSQLGVIFELLTGQEHPTAGSIQVAGVDPFDWSRRRRFLHDAEDPEEPPRRNGLHGYR